MDFNQNETQIETVEEIEISLEDEIKNTMIDIREEVSKKDEIIKELNEDINIKKMVLLEVRDDMLSLLKGIKKEETE